MYEGNMYEIFGYLATVTLTLMNAPLTYGVFFQNVPIPPLSFLFLSLGTSLFFTLYGIGIAFDSDIWIALPMLISNPCSFLLIFVILVKHFKKNNDNDKSTP